MTMKISSLQWHQFIVILLAAFAFFMAGLVSERVFEGVPHLEDELAYLFQAKVFAGGQVMVESPENRSAHWQPFVIDSNETGYRFGKYTPGWSAFLAIGVWMGQAWIVNAVLAALSVALIYRLGREIFNAEVGVIAALLTAFSPAALLLNGSLMSHTTGLFLSMLFIYAYWRMEKGKRVLVWGLIAGLALGASAATRPLTTVAVGLPFVAWSGARLLKTLLASSDKKKTGLLAQKSDDELELSPQLADFWEKLKPLLLLAMATLIIASSIPLYSYLATGDAGQNLYELVWDYDRVGFGEGYGRNTHRLAKAYAHTRFDLSLTAADLFGWQFEPIEEEEIRHLQNEADYYPARGYSFVLLPIGLLIGLFAYDAAWKKRLVWLVPWAIVAVFWAWMPTELPNHASAWQGFFAVLGLNPTLIDNPQFSWFWVISALLWLYLPVLILAWEKPELAYTWLFMTIVLGIVVVQMTYWIGSQRYSTRYYYEALGAATLLTALPLGWLARKLGRNIVVPAIFALSVFSLYFYSTPRIDVLYHFNGVRGELIEEVLAARLDERPILVIVNGPSQGDERVRWAAYSSLLAVTSPYYDSEIVVLRDSGTLREELIASYPDRQVIDVDAEAYSAWVRGSR